jgi:hypothetical protein
MRSAKSTSISGIGMATLLAISQAGCDAGNAPTPAGSPTGGVDYRDVAALTTRVRPLLPEGWSVIRIEQDTHPWYLNDGKGTAMYLGPEPRPQAKATRCAVFVMPPDYPDRTIPLEDQNKNQTWPPHLIASTPRAKIYFWGGIDGPGNEEFEASIRDALTR